ncbi:hypothetical protein C8T65DRAFT_700141 [Cerioporus squamosus]|nr:hypothetical protein C8T65DRAFT_700141 [Cerioporus squamosus]
MSESSTSSASHSTWAGSSSFFSVSASAKAVSDGLYAAAYYLPVYFQVLGASATGAGMTLPSSLGSALVSVAGGEVVSRTGHWGPGMWFAWLLVILGWGLMHMIMLNARANALTRPNVNGAKVLYPLTAANGLESLFQCQADSAHCHRGIPQDAAQRAAATRTNALSVRTIWIAAFLAGCTAAKGSLQGPKSR